MEQPPIKLDVDLTVSQPIQMIAVCVVVFLYIDISFKITKFIVKWNNAYD